MFSSCAACERLRRYRKLMAEKVSLLTDLTMDIQTQFVWETISILLKLQLVWKWDNCIQFLVQAKELWVYCNKIRLPKCALLEAVFLESWSCRRQVPTNSGCQTSNLHGIKCWRTINWKTPLVKLGKLYPLLQIYQCCYGIIFWL